MSGEIKHWNFHSAEIPSIPDSMDPLWVVSKGILLFPMGELGCQKPFRLSTQEVCPDLFVFSTNYNAGNFIQKHAHLLEMTVLVFDRRSSNCTIELHGPSIQIYDMNGEPLCHDLHAKIAALHELMPPIEPFSGELLLVESGKEGENLAYSIELASEKKESGQSIQFWERFNGVGEYILVYEHLERHITAMIAEARQIRWERFMGGKRNASLSEIVKELNR